MRWRRLRPDVEFNQQGFPHEVVDVLSNHVDWEGLEDEVVHVRMRGQMVEVRFGGPGGLVMAFEDGEMVSEVLGQS